MSVTPDQILFPQACLFDYEFEIIYTFSYMHKGSAMWLLYGIIAIVGRTFFPPISQFHFVNNLVTNINNDITNITRNSNKPLTPYGNVTMIKL